MCLAYQSGSKTIKNVEAPILPEGSSWERNVLNSFAGGKSNSVTYGVEQPCIELVERMVDFGA